MGSKTDIAKGRMKEAAGAITNDEKLKAEGQTDQAVGEAKGVVERATDKVKDMADAASKSVKKTID
ncbi:MAG: CsbD family protein [Planctomycetaceae bacterium]|nr:MAG: CsbD family protein [Planctomycetaceae bacterium]